MTGNGEQEGGDLIPIGNEVEPHGFLRGRDDELLHHVVGVHHDFDALGLEQGKHTGNQGNAIEEERVAVVGQHQIVVEDVQAFDLGIDEGSVQQQRKAGQCLFSQSWLYSHDLCVRQFSVLGMAEEKVLDGEEHVSPNLRVLGVTVFREERIDDLGVFEIVLQQMGVVQALAKEHSVAASLRAAGVARSESRLFDVTIEQPCEGCASHLLGACRRRGRSLRCCVRFARRGARTRFAPIHQSHTPFRLPDSIHSNGWCRETKGVTGREGQADSLDLCSTTIRIAFRDALLWIADSCASV